MTKQEFLNRLSQLLADLAPEEQQEAMQYYSECFEEAGPEGEQELIEQLGSPEKVAAIIRANVPQCKPETDGAAGAPVQPSAAPVYNQPATNPIKNLKSQKGLMILLLVVLFPLWIGAAACVFGIALSVLGIIVGFAVSALGCFAGGIGALIRAFLSMDQGFGTVLMTISMAFFDFALGFAMLGLTTLVVKIPLWIWHRLKNWQSKRQAEKEESGNETMD